MAQPGRSPGKPAPSRENRAMSQTPTFDPELLSAGRLIAEVTQSVLRITLDRPEIRNAQLPATWEALAHIASRLNDEIRVVVVRGAGPSFSAGLDRSAFRLDAQSPLARIAGAPPAIADSIIADYQAGFSWLSDPRFISIAAVQGHAIGAGFQLALACDLVIAGDDAQFAMAEVTLGLVPDLTGTSRLTRAVGRQRALELCATGRRVDAAEAVRIGLAMVAVPAADLDAAVDNLTAALLAADPEAVRAVTRLIASAADSTPEAQNAAERAEQITRLRALAARG